LTEPHACSDAELISSFEGSPAIPPLLRLIARGRPVGLAELAAESGQPAPDLERILRAQPGTEWDEEGRLVGFGLSLRPTAHRYLVGGHTLYTWCATDTLFFTVILGTDAVAASTCPATGEAIRLEITPDAVTSVSPAGAVVSQRHRGGLVSNLRADVCDHGHFFASEAAASAWMVAHPDGEILSVADAFDHCRRACEQLGWLVPGTIDR
jgi:alkylmercury lyase